MEEGKGRIGGLWESDHDADLWPHRKEQERPMSARQTLKEQTAGGCQLIALLTAGQPVCS